MIVISSIVLNEREISSVLTFSQEICFTLILIICKELLFFQIEYIWEVHTFLMVSMTYSYGCRTSSLDTGIHAACPCMYADRLTISVLLTDGETLLNFRLVILESAVSCMCLPSVTYILVLDYL